MRVVDLALKQKADAVMVAGDAIDASSNYFEAFDPLESGTRKLAEAGIETFFTAGNHDFDTLPRICEQMQNPHVHLLGKGGNWERHTLDRGGQRLHLDGWSFHASTHPANPLLGYPRGQDGTSALGILHADVDQPQSQYAPCPSSELLVVGPAVWLLGHVHATRKWSNESSRAVEPRLLPRLAPGARSGRTRSTRRVDLELGAGNHT
jgi:DNA repair exonuclease SbcCD nuclease subunit